MRSGIGLLFVLILSSILAGCGPDSDKKPLPSTADHDPGYRFRHGSEALQNLSSCQRCHGRDYSGTDVATSCFACHPRPGPPFVMHPPSREPSRPWTFPVNHGSEAKKDIGACQRCHGETGGLGSNPSFGIPIGALEQGCESVEGCHLGGSFNHGHDPRTAHPAMNPDGPGTQDLMHWYGERIAFVGGSGEEQIYLTSHYNAENLVDACALCHGEELEGGVGPACTDCHVMDPIANPTRCVSCHGSPVGPTVELIREVGRTEELAANSVYRAFVNEVSRGFHLEHDTIVCQDRDSVDDCRGCHGTSANANRHHARVGATIPGGSVVPVGAPGEEYDCLACHEMVYNPLIGELEFAVVRPCDACHVQPFAPTPPCPE